MAKQFDVPLPTTLKLPEAVELLEEHRECSSGHAQDILERAIRDGSLCNISIFHPDGGRIDKKDVTDWRNIDWQSGRVDVEGSWSGSPPTLIPVEPLLDRSEFLKIFEIDATTKAAQRKSGGRPPQYDWDAFWIEVCQRIDEDGLPEKQSELVEIMLDWFSDRGNENIDRRTIEKKISDLFVKLRYKS